MSYFTTQPPVTGTQALATGSSIAVTNMSMPEGITAAYLSALNTINSIYQNSTGADAASLNNAINALLNLAEGKTASGASPPAGSYIAVNQGMAQSIANIQISWNAASNNLITWRNLGAYGLSSVLQAAGTAPYPSGSSSALDNMQTMIEIDYVSTANLQINKQLSTLMTQLSTTNGILTNLNDLQDIANQITVNSPGQLAEFFSTQFPTAYGNVTTNGVSTVQEYTLSTINSNTYRNLLLTSPYYDYLISNFADGTGGNLQIDGSVFGYPPTFIMQTALQFFGVSNITDFVNAYTKAAQQGGILPFNSNALSLTANNTPIEINLNFKNALTGEMQSINTGNRSTNTATLITIAKTVALNIYQQELRQNNAGNFAGFQNPLDPIIASMKGSNAAIGVSMVAKFNAAYTWLKGLSLANSNSMLVKNAPNLASRLATVLKDMQVGMPAGGGPATLSSMSVWIMDNLNQASKSGIPAGNITKANLMQTDLTNAITAAESLNDSQKTNLQSQLYTFQQFYQSAGAMLQTLKQITQQFSQNINR